MTRFDASWAPGMGLASLWDKSLKNLLINTHCVNIRASRRSQMKVIIFIITLMAINVVQAGEAKTLSFRKLVVERANRTLEGIMVAQEDYAPGDQPLELQIEQNRREQQYQQAMQPHFEALGNIGSNYLKEHESDFQAKPAGVCYKNAVGGQSCY